MTEDEGLTAARHGRSPIAFGDAVKEVCPGCRKQFVEGDITDVLPDPWWQSTKVRRWHLYCHQEIYKPRGLSAVEGSTKPEDVKP